jgi:hypothetical protein
MLFTDHPGKPGSLLTGYNAESSYKHLFGKGRINGGIE